MGAALLVASGRRTGARPRRRSQRRSRDAGLDVVGLTLHRAEGGRSQLYRAAKADGTTVFVKVYGRDSRDADLLYRGYRTAVLRGPNDAWPSASSLQARRGARGAPADAGPTSRCDLPGGRAHRPGCPTARWCSRSSDVDGSRLDDARARRGRRRAARRDVAGGADTARRGASPTAPCGPANVLVTATVRSSSTSGSARSRRRTALSAIDRAELLTSLAVLVGADRAVASACGSSAPTRWSRRCRTSSRSRCRRRPGSRRRSRCSTSCGPTVATTTGRRVAGPARAPRPGPAPHPADDRRCSSGAFYAAAPPAGQRRRQLRRRCGTPNWGWLAARGGDVEPHLRGVGDRRSSAACPTPVPLRADGRGADGVVVREPGHAGQRRRDGVERALPAEGGRRPGGGGDRCRPQLARRRHRPHRAAGRVLRAGPARTARRRSRSRRAATVLVVIAVVLALAGIVVATRRGRRLVRTHVVGFLQRSWTSMAALARPRR